MIGNYDWRMAMVACALLAGCGGDGGDGTVAHGTVEVREIDVAPLAAGRVVRVLVDEGASVTAGDTLVILTAPTLAADESAAAARLASAEAVLRDLQAGARTQEIAAARSTFEAARTDAARLEKDRQRLVALRDAGAIAPREYDAAAAAATIAAERVRSASEQVSLLEAGTRPQQVAAARAEVASARAALAAREATSAEFVLTAPMAGTVISRLAEPGDLLGSGMPALVVGVTAAPWVRVYVPARTLPTIAVGQRAAIYPPGPEGAAAAAKAPVADVASLDAGGEWGRIVAINPQAEYVTRIALTEEERADLLFGVKIAIEDSAGRFKPGMPVTVRLIETRSDAP